MSKKKPLLAALFSDDDEEEEEPKASSAASPSPTRSQRLFHSSVDHPSMRSEYVHYVLPNFNESSRRR